MRTIHIRIGHDHDLVIAKLCDIEIIAVAFGKTAAKGIDHGLDLRVGQHLVNAGLLHVQDLAADRQDRLIIPVSGCLGRTACGISLYDERSHICDAIPALTVGQLAVGIKGIFLLGQKVGLGTFLGLTDLRRLFRTAERRSFSVSRFRSK